MIFVSLLSIIKVILSICFVLGTIALVHEFGHFIIAKLTGIWVIEFAIGFGNRLLKFKIGETIYSLRPLPLGGFVRLAGMDEPDDEENSQNNEKKEAEKSSSNPIEASQSSKSEKINENIDEDDKIPIIAPDDPRGFPSKSRIVKTLVLSAGSIMNILWAVVLFVVIYTVFGGYLSNIVVLDVIKDKPAEKVGIKPGDIITAINEEKIQDWNEGVKKIRNSGGREIVLNIARNHLEPRPGFGGGILSEDIAFNRTSYSVSVQENIKVNIVPEGGPGTGMIGISLAPHNFDFKELPISRAIRKSIESTTDIISQTVFGFIRMFTGKASADVAGPVKIMQMIKDQSKKGISDLLYLTALLSINIGLINMLPFPVLDGGRIIFVLLEAIFALLWKLTGIKIIITPKFEEKIHFAGLIFLLLVLLLVTYKDIRSFF